MRTIAIGIALFAFAVAPALPAGPTAQASSITCRCFGKDVRWSDRRDPAEARFGITTEGGELNLLLTDREVVFQLSDRTLRKVHRELRNAREEQEDNWLASTIVTAVTGVVREVLDHSAVCWVSDLRDVDYRDGHLVFIGRNGRLVFEDHDDCDSDFSSSFSERDARAFVREFRLLKAGK